MEKENKKADIFREEFKRVSSYSEAEKFLEKQVKAFMANGVSKVAAFQNVCEALLYEMGRANKPKYYRDFWILAIKDFCRNNNIAESVVLIPGDKKGVETAPQIDTFKDEDISVNARVVAGIDDRENWF